MRIQILDLAEHDLREGVVFYENQQAGIGHYFLNSIYSEIDSLLLFSGIHIRVFGYFRQLSKRFPYAVYYTLNDDVIFVWRVLDLRRSPSWIEEQLRDAGTDS